MAVLVLAVAAAAAATVALGTLGGAAPAAPLGNYVLFGYSDSGMHFILPDYSKVCLLPPSSTIRAQVIRRGDGPEIVHEDNITVTYSIPGNTHAADKSNFWEHVQSLFGVDLAPDVGLTGHRLTGSMSYSSPDYRVTGVPLLPIADDGRLNPYQAAHLTVTGPAGTATIDPVVPVSSEMTCSLCHGNPFADPAADMLEKHDGREGTDLLHATPVLCSSCHADSFTGQPGQAGVSSLSTAMHSLHVKPVEGVGFDNACYACHPGFRTEAQRDVHRELGMHCVDCHGDMTAVADPSRVPWSDLPRCGDCHRVPGHEYEQAGKLYKESVGHKGVTCLSCHGPPHAITATITPIDNQEAIVLQGHSGTINTCNVCHTVTPGDPFFHSVGGDD